jgi:purine nucleosidase
MPIDILIDSDPGMGYIGSDVDDNLAILWALSDERVQVRGITLTYGNVELQEAWLSLSKTLREAHKEDIPFALGCKKPLIRPYESAKEWKVRIAKQKGLPLVFDNSLLEGVEPLSPVSVSAAEFILSMVTKYPRLTILALGPLTNIALAIKLAPEKIANVERIVIMGGSINEAGNMSPVSEFNILCDPEAAEIVFSSGLPITMVGLDVTHKVNIYLEEVLKAIGPEKSCSSQLTSFVVESIRKWIHVREAIFGQNYFNPHDAIAFAYLLYPELFHVEKMYLLVETSGFRTLGEVIGVLPKQRNRYPLIDFEEIKPADVCLQIDEGRFKDLFFKFLQNLCKLGR